MKLAITLVATFAVFSSVFVRADPSIVQTESDSEELVAGGRRLARPYYPPYEDDCDDLRGPIIRRPPPVYDYCEPIIRNPPYVDDCYLARYPEYDEWCRYFGGAPRFRILLKLLEKYIFNRIEENGLKIGNWGIREEGECDGALVFRDLKAKAQGRDRRYAMFPNKFVNL